MPTPIDAMLGLVVAALGSLMLVVAFNLSDERKKKISYVLSGIVMLMGMYYFLSAQVRGFTLRRRIAEIQRNQQVNVEEIQRNLRNQTSQSAPAGK